MRLKQVVDRYKDLELNLYQLNAAADAVTEFYRDRGYTLARAVVPPQKVEDGVVTLAVIEGQLGRVLFSGNRSYETATLQRHVPNLKPGNLLTTDKLERSLLLLNDMPGLKVRSTLSPGAEFGASDVLVKVEEKRFNLNLNVDNAGRKETGERRTDINLDINNPLGYGDQFSIRTLLTDQQLLKYRRVGYSFPVNDDGLRVSTSFSEARYDVAGAFAALGLSGLARTTEMTLTSPRVRSRGYSQSLSVGLRYVNLKQETLGVETSSVTMPLMVFGYQSNKVDEDASVTNLSFQASTNFRRNSNGLQQDAQMLRLEGDISYLLPLSRQWDMFLRGNAVWSHDRLADSEKMSIGGPGSVRGYRASEIRGDSGLQGTVEFRRNFSLLGRPGNVSMFCDMGQVIYKMPGFSDGRQDISSLGMGVTAYPMGASILKLEVARTASNFVATDHKNTRLWLSLGTSF